MTFLMRAKKASAPSAVAAFAPASAPTAAVPAPAASVLATALAALLLAGGLALTTQVMLPQQAHAKTTAIAIGGKKHSAKASFRVGKVSWNKSTQMLTFSKAKGLGAIKISGSGTVKVKVSGTCTMAKNASIYSTSGSLKLIGSGSLSMSGWNCGISAEKDLTLAGPKVAVKNPDGPGFSATNITVSAGKAAVYSPVGIGFSAVVEKARSSRIGTFKVTGGTAQVYGKSFSGGIEANDVRVSGGRVSVSGGGDVEARSRTYLGKSYGGSLYVTGGKLDVAKNVSAEHGKVKCSCISVGGSVTCGSANFTHSSMKYVKQTAPDHNASGYKAHYVCSKCHAWTKDSAGKQPISDHGSWRYCAHSLNYESEDLPTPTAAGCKAHYECEHCGKWFSDAEAAAEVTEASQTIPPHSHSLSYVEEKAPTSTATGYADHYECGSCGRWFSDPDAETPVLQESLTASFDVAPKDDLASYSWYELKVIADQVSACASEVEAIEKAKYYNLVGADGKLTGNETKPVTVKGHLEGEQERYQWVDSGSSRVEVQILGFWHDEKSDGSGKAGITFGFKDVIDWHAMNPAQTKAGGWESCEMRAYVNGAVYDSLPAALRSGTVSVSKMTNNTGYGADESAVTATSEKLWLLSAAECFGGSYTEKFNEIWSYRSEYKRFCPAVYNAEGVQYKLYVDNEVSVGSCSPLLGRNLEKSDYGQLYWALRSPYIAFSSSAFFVCYYSGYGFSAGDSQKIGVSPGFCL